MAETLLPLIDDNSNKAVEMAEEAIKTFQGIYEQKWLGMMSSKLGLCDVDSGDGQLVADLLDWMRSNKADYTNTFLELGKMLKPAGKIYEQERFEEWYSRWKSRLGKDYKSMESAVSLMKSTNPAVIPRNHKVEEALEEANSGNLGPCHDLLAALLEPYEDRESLRPYQSPAEPTEYVYQTFCGT